MSLDPFDIPFSNLQGITPKNDLERYFFTNQDRIIHKWFHYFEIYERYFSQFRNRPINLLEIGISKGGSLQMWKHYFGPQCKIHGIDIEPSCKAFEEDQIEITIGSQEDRGFWRAYKDNHPKFDIIIDDGGHTMNQQIVTYDEMFSHLNTGGIYLCEDVHTSYWGPDYNGGYKGDNFIEYTKNFIDYLHAWYSQDVPTKYETYNIHGIHYYDSIVVVEKREKSAPFHTKTGK